MKKGLLIVVSGPSGVGKGTVCKAFLKKYKEVFLSVSATTRKPREGEVDGENYYFIKKDDFLEKIENNGFLEYAEYVDNYYGTPKNVVLDKLDAGQDVLLEIELQGAMKVKKAYSEALFIFLLPPNMKILRDRIEKRGTENIDIIDKRMEKAQDEIDFIEYYDYIVVNEDVEVAADTIYSIIESEKYRVVRNKELIEEIRGQK